MFIGWSCDDLVDLDEKENRKNLYRVSSAPKEEFQRKFSRKPPLERPSRAISSITKRNSPRFVRLKSHFLVWFQLIVFRFIGISFLFVFQWQIDEWWRSSRRFDFLLLLLHRRSIWFEDFVDQLNELSSKQHRRQYSGSVSIIKEIQSNSDKSPQRLPNPSNNEEEEIPPEKLHRMKKIQFAKQVFPSCSSFIPFRIVHLGEIISRKTPSKWNLFRIESLFTRSTSD